MKFSTNIHGPQTMNAADSRAPQTLFFYTHNQQLSHDGSCETILKPSLFTSFFFFFCKSMWHTSMFTEFMIKKWVSLRFQGSQSASYSDLTAGLGFKLPNYQSQALSYFIFLGSNPDETALWIANGFPHGDGIRGGNKELGRIDSNVLLYTWLVR